MTDWQARLQLHTLNPEQRQAVMHRQGPLLVLAGAGSGKTRVIITRIAAMIAEGIDPKRILGVTFTNKAAREMRMRLSSLVRNKKKSEAVHLSTFHSLGLDIVRREHRTLGLQARFCIYDRSDQLGLVRDLLRRTQVADRRLDVSRVLELMLAAKKNGLLKVPIETGDDYELAAHLMFDKYIDQMRAFQAVDFDDLLLLALKALENPKSRRRWQSRFDYLLVDEYQDTSSEQLALVRLLSERTKNLCVVGDDDQSIYAWRGADARNILDFERQFTGTHEVILDQNYRSVNAVLTTANQIIAHNKERKVKRLWSERGVGDAVQIVACADPESEAMYVSNEIQKLIYHGVPCTDIAILYRSNLLSRPFEEALAMDRVPFCVVGGQAFFERKEVKDAIALLQVINNPNNELALRRIINVPPRGIGPKTVETLSEHAETKDYGLWRSVKEHTDLDSLGAAAKNSLSRFVSLIETWGPRLRGLSPDNAEQEVAAFLDAVGLRDAIMSANDPATITERRLGHLREVTKGIGRIAPKVPPDQDILDVYLSHAALEPHQEDDVPDEGVTLMTIHASKGLEFPYVFLVGVEEDIMPHRKSVEEGGSIEEERRLCYVGVTRAKDRLWMTHTRFRVVRGMPKPITRSRFIDEVSETEHLAFNDVGSEGVLHASVVNAAEGPSMAERALASMRAQLGIEDDGS